MVGVGASGVLRCSSVHLLAAVELGQRELCPVVLCPQHRALLELPVHHEDIGTRKLNLKVCDVMNEKALCVQFNTLRVSAVEHLHRFHPGPHFVK